MNDIVDLELIRGEEPDVALIKAGDALAQAQHDWCEAFLRYKLSTPPKGQKIVTDTQAKAMAELDTNLMEARVAYDYAMLRYRHETLRDTPDPGLEDV